MHSPFIREWEDEIPVTQSQGHTSLWEGVSPFLEIPSEQHFFNVLPDFGKIYDNWKEKIGNWKEKLEYWAEKAKKNTIYANRLGWSRYSELISELLLKTTGESNKDHTSAHFAYLVALWQGKNGFSGKDVDGVIGPNTWRKMQPLLGIKESTKVEVSSVNPKTVAKVQQYSNLIERISNELNFNPNIVRGIIAAESNGNRYSGQGGKGYKGLMQAKRDEDQFDPEISIRTGIGIFKEMRDRNLGPRLAKLGIDKAQIDDETFLRLVLCSYNAGHVSVLKALFYAKENGNWRDWFQGPYYKRGLLFTGAYSKYSKCGTEGLEQAKKDAALYRFKRGIHWMKQPDPPKWEEAINTISPLLRCWIETKYGNTPGYLNKILEYFRYFEGLGTTHELEFEDFLDFNEAEIDDEKQYQGTQSYYESESDEYGIDREDWGANGLEKGQEVDFHSSRNELAFEDEAIFDETSEEEDWNSSNSISNFSNIDFGEIDVDDKFESEFDTSFEEDQFETEAIIEDDYENEFLDFEIEQESEEAGHFVDMSYEQESYNLEPDFEEEIEFEELYDDELEAEKLLDYELAVKKVPLAVPADNPISFAPIPALGSFWPLISTHSRGKEVAFQYRTQPPAFAGNGSRSFLARRANGARYHVGIDLYANHKDKVVACEDGVIINFYHFYRSTYALLVEHDKVVINYGEVHSDSLKANRLKVGDRNLKSIW